jgi:MFS family permease
MQTGADADGRPRRIGMKPGGAIGLRTALRLINVAAFLFSSMGAFFYLLPVYLHQMGSSPAQIGLVAGLMRVSSLVARPVAGRLLDRFGRRPVIGVGTGVSILAILSLFLFPQFGGFFLFMRILQGFGTSLVDSGLGAVVADLSPPTARAQVFAMYTVWLTLPGGIMPAVGEAIARHVGFLPLFGAAAFAMVAFFLVFRRLPETMRSSQEGSSSGWGLSGMAPPALLGVVLVGLVFGVSSVFVPVAPIAAKAGRVGLFFFAYFIGLIGVRLGGGLGLTWLSRPAVLPPAYGLMTLGLAILPFGDSAWLLFLVGLCCGAGHGSIVPVMYALLLSGVARERRGWVVSLQAAAFDTGAVLGTMGLGLVAEWTGYRGVFAVAAAAVAGGAVAAHLWGRRQRSR